MRKILLFVYLIIAFTSYAQQDQQYTQFMYNKLGYNPAYAGSMGWISATGLVRSQWLGLEGAPNTQLLSVDASLYEKRIGLGFNIVRHTIGISERYDFDAAYAYRMSVGKGLLGVGIQGTVRFLQANFADERLVATQAPSMDNAIPVGMQSKLLPNFGLGIFYNDDKAYLGISAPRLIENNTDFNQEATVISREVRHLYLMGGYLFDLSESVQIQPQALIKYTQNVPLDMDINVNMILSKRYTIGTTFRVGGSSEDGPIESIDLLFSAQINSQLIFGIAYDVTISQLRSYNSGSIEGMVRYTFTDVVLERKNEEEQSEEETPRFF